MHELVYSVSVPQVVSTTEETPNRRRLAGDAVARQLVWLQFLFTPPAPASLPLSLPSYITYASPGVLVLELLRVKLYVPCITRRSNHTAHDRPTNWGIAIQSFLIREVPSKNKQVLQLFSDAA